MLPIKPYSKKDISTWKQSNIIYLYVEIKKNIPRFEINFDTYKDRAESMKQMIKDTLNKYKINDLEIFINLMDYPCNNPYFLAFSYTTNCIINTVPNFSFYQWDHAKTSNIVNTKIKILDNINEWNYPNIENFFDIKKKIINNIKLWKYPNIDDFLNIKKNILHCIIEWDYPKSEYLDIKKNILNSVINWDYPNATNFFDIKKIILDNKIEWDNKENKIMWSGINSNKIREQFNNFVKNSNLYEFNLIESYSTNPKYYKLSDHNKYKYLLDFEGVGYSGRVPYLLLTGSCVILLENTDPNRDYNLYYSKYFKEDIHYLKIQYTINDTMESIHEKIQEKIKVSDCKKIGMDCQELATSIFTLDNVLLYMSEILKHYSQYYQNTDDILNPDLEYYKETNMKNIKNRLINKFKKH
jgi:hypothetical protein